MYMVCVVIKDPRPVADGRSKHAKCSLWHAGTECIWRMES
jgi:hypothetical protein